MKTEITVRNCPLFKFRCSQTWEGLMDSADEKVRHCEQCDCDVHYCASDAETIEHAQAGHCIAREVPSDSELPRLYLGQPSPELTRMTAEQERALQWTTRERAVDDALKNVDSARSCPECGYPAPVWRTDCRVCGFQMGRWCGDG